MRRLKAEDLGDCFAHDKDRLTHDEALALIDDRARTMVGNERVPLVEAASRYAAEPVAASRPVPGHDNAAVDGYALAHRDLDPATPTTLRVADRIAAGDGALRALAPGTATRIFTGAAMPNGADTVVMQEDVADTGDGRVTVPGGLKAGANLRHAGEDLKPDETVLEAGQVLRPQDVAALATIGHDPVDVFVRLRVGILSSGDEVVAPGADLGPSQVHDANGPLLASLLRPLPVTVVPLGIVPDRADTVRTRLDEAADRCDVVITSGGASRGEEDHIVHTIAAHGALHAWQIAIKPGRPLGFGTYRDSAVMLLPGNPVAVMVCFLLYIRPWLAGLGGGRTSPPLRIPVPAAFEIPNKKPDRREFLRGRLVDRDGDLAVTKYPRDGSGLISSLRAADGLIEIPEAVRRVDTGDRVAFIPFSAFGLAGC